MLQEVVKLSTDREIIMTSCDGMQRRISFKEAKRIIKYQNAINTLVRTGHLFYDWYTYDVETLDYIKKHCL